MDQNKQKKIQSPQPMGQTPDKQLAQVLLSAIPTAIQPKLLPIILLLRVDTNSNLFSVPFTPCFNVAATFLDRRSILTVCY
jgi:hypothetical protein